MKKIILFVFLLVFVGMHVQSQITSPIIKARFGVDADVRTNFFNGAVSSGNDDGFTDGTPGTGEYVIDTTGAAALIKDYLNDVSPWPKRMSSFYRSMSKPPFSVVSNRLWLDAIFVRDYHGNDTTVFTAGADKNGMSPEFWTGGIQSVPDKNDILDIMVHVRRAGPNTTDSLWMFGGISLDNTTGNRYFDFEMYQSDIYYDRATKKFYGYGPDAGHTSWKFDAAGNIISPGDIIFNGEFQSGTLTNIEARIWVKRSDWQTLVPTAFNWGLKFDGSASGSEYGYASISPNTAGAFYTGLGSSNNTWAGPFGLVLQDNSLSYSNPGPASTTNSKYIANQFIEFSVNLTKLGLDPVTLLGGDVCGTPFNRIIVKTRSSSSFTAELKDFVAPTDLFLAPRALAATETPFICDDGSGVVEIEVSNPIATSVYEWSTPDGNIISDPGLPTIFVNLPGTYIVRQYLQAGCSLYASDTIEIAPFLPCNVLTNRKIDLTGHLTSERIALNWNISTGLQPQYFDVQRSFDGIHFTAINRLEFVNGDVVRNKYSYVESPAHWENVNQVFYRIRAVMPDNSAIYSSTIRIPLNQGQTGMVKIWPNPVKDMVQIQITATRNTQAQLSIFNASGELVYNGQKSMQSGVNLFSLDILREQPRGFYFARVTMDGNTYYEKLVLAK